MWQSLLVTVCFTVVLLVWWFALREGAAQTGARPDDWTARAGVICITLVYISIMFLTKHYN